MKTVAIIPARGGSKRIPGKNIRHFNGKPIIAYSILAALKADSIDRVIVSTDSDEIATVAKSLGAEIPFMRPAELSDDQTATLPVIQHAIQQLNPLPELVCCLYPTAPFITAEKLDAAYKILIKNQANYVFSACDYDFPVQRALELSELGVTPMFPEFIHKRSQDLPKTLHDAGQFYWGQAKAFIQQLPIFAEHSRAFILPRAEVLDIDTEADWQQAEAMYHALTMKRTQNYDSV